jgi:DNA-binding GntR family transcriptional regulator
MAIEHCTGAEITALKNTNTAFHKAVKAGNTMDIARLDEDFHEQIFSMTKNSLLINLNKLVTVEFRKYRLMSFSIHENCLNAIVPHNNILNAIRRRDEADGVNQMAKHLKQVIIDMDKMVAQA